MSAPKLRQAIENFAGALARLEEAMSLPPGEEVTRDVVILRFMLVHETSWKALRQALAVENVEVRYPKEAFRQAYQVGWLAHETPWITMLGDRNLVAHTYNEATAIRVFEDVRGYLPEFRQLLAFLRERFG